MMFYFNVDKPNDWLLAVRNAESENKRKTRGGGVAKVQGRRGVSTRGGRKLSPTQSVESPDGTDNSTENGEKSANQNEEQPNNKVR